MLRAAVISILILFLLPSCKNTVGGSEKLPVEIVNTAHLKNTPHTIDSSSFKDMPEAVVALYSDNGYKTLWTDVTDRKALHKAIKEAGSDGLLPSEYNISELEQYEADINITEAECVQYDLLLTESFRTLANHLFKGKLRPSKLYYDWALAPKKLDANKLLLEGLENRSIAEVLDRCRPVHPVYAGLRKSLQYLNDLPDDTNLPQIKLEGSIKLNDAGDAVAAVKKRLIYWGDLERGDTIDNTYGRTAMKAVKRFQQRHGLYPNGIIDARTTEMLNVTKQQRIEQVVVNLERWRWFAYDFGKNALLINIPDYRMAVLENNNDTIEVYNIVVGKPERRTPILQSVLNNLVFNPTWTVPPTILKEDLVPDATEDRNYFAEHNMKIYYGNDTIETLPEEWQPDIADHYRYVQGPGIYNALGQVKFNFRNGYYVYLHDTNHRELFNRSYRALSSGCVRVQDPCKLAGYILDNEERDWTAEKMQEIVAIGETKNVGLSKKTHVHQLYWTAWMDKGGLQFRSDIYNLDKALYNKLRQ